MDRKKGQISVNTENIFPIIRKWLYSDHDIFLRELVSNASDAIHKYQDLLRFGDAPADPGFEPRIEVVYDADEKTLSVSDNGLGMTAEELERYINQIAFSGALDFVQKYKDKSDGSGIIGHFGLGFYSVFMVSEHVTIETKSWNGAAEAVRWDSDEGQDFEMGPSDRAERGTTVLLHLDAEAEKEFTGPRFREILDKYCQFMPYPIYFHDVKADADAAERRTTAYKSRLEAYEKRRKEAADKGENFEEEAPTPADDPSAKPVNNTEPLWLKKASDCKDEDYKAFYHEAFRDFREPLFWIHLNMDYPFRLKGILYFPQYENKYESLEGRIKLYNNQVFVADNIKEVIPDFLFLLKGVLDCPDLPLNVSRSFLQNDAYVRKLSDHIVRKVADRLNKLFKDDRERYASYWKDIEIFVKYGCLRDHKFFDRVKDCLLFRTTEDSFKTLAELGENVSYVAEPEKQALYIRNAKEQGKMVLVLNGELDPHFIQFLEQQTKLRFRSLDSFPDEGEKKPSEAEAEKASLAAYTGLFRKAVGDAKLEIQLQKLGNSAPPALIRESEENRRMQEMRRSFERMQGRESQMDLDALFPLERKLVLNLDSALVQRLRPAADETTADDTAAADDAAKTTDAPAADSAAAPPAPLGQRERLAKTLYELALLAHGSLQSEQLADFVQENAQLLAELAERWLA